MNCSRFEYFLNAVHYCIYLEEIWSTKKFEGVILKVLHYLSRLFAFESFYKRKTDAYNKNSELKEYMYGKNWGQSIGLAHHFFGYFYSGYPVFFSFVLGGFALKLFDSPSNIVKLVLLAIPIGLCYIPAYKAVFTNDRYLKYFKQFEKEDEQWHKKWKRITIAFCVGSVIVTLLGICMAFAIAIS